MWKITFIILVLVNLVSANESWERIVDLRGQWKFSLGDNIAWADPDFDDTDWETIFAPAAWEDEGFPGYDGYAWYRKTVYLDREHSRKSIYIRLGQIDDVDEVYVNGYFVGFQGSFPPAYSTAYNVERNYRIPHEYLNFGGENLISVRVYDKELHGGILNGRIGLYYNVDEIIPEISLEGVWKFNPGDDMRWKEPNYDDWQWRDIMVPAPWETQGYKNYDGFAWYRKKVFIPEKYRGERLFLFLGRIDDVDEAYFNGDLAGNTGSIEAQTIRFSMNEDWLEWRAYRLDAGSIRFGADNVIAVRVYDGWIHGGIYEGPVGIMTYDTYREWRNRTGQGKRSFFEKLFNN